MGLVVVVLVRTTAAIILVIVFDISDADVLLLPPLSSLSIFLGTFVIINELLGLGVMRVRSLVMFGFVITAKE